MIKVDTMTKTSSGWFQLTHTYRWYSDDDNELIDYVSEKIPWKEINTYGYRFRLPTPKF